MSVTLLLSLSSLIPQSWLSWLHQYLEEPAMKKVFTFCGCHNTEHSAETAEK